MSRTIQRSRRFLTADGGTTAVEYAVMLAFIVTVLFGVVASIGTTASGEFSSVSAAVASAS